ncbi:MAG: NADH:ubiquinone oxidoreductase subunit NDUFA12 [Phaeovulum sp.]|uniref:NADH:ubiquinone oxidoreductase subunit NDUFA12 n=1 Tax=Phaeovulum sp. TaxID=2934796 RepID=UPI002731959D|nr:NADH:ubiquinone oxidoreductase subunit NDUFA12 [Phaeovulum sp.]MDP2063043.1 NADH:ubiquinone oxidoreductase subunit NDUFA12 [Phaeovulum sp.]MDP3861022.1 NADH:ubiquinone oxidoreductase subunit NDUFA12 [Phaeovulum sp.]
MKFLLRLLTWWNGQTLGTQVYTWRKGVRVGEDVEGNIYYRTRDDKRRWVIYNGVCEPSRISADWNGWLHHTYADAPSDVPMPRKGWELPHQANLSGTPGAYAPAGSLRRAAPVERRDYEAWQPE